VKLKLWSYGANAAAASSALAVAGTALNWWLGGCDQMIQALVAFMAVDFVLGFLAAAKSGSVDSRVMFWGGVNKLLVLVLVGVGVILDRLTGLSVPAVRTVVIWFYIGREGLSITENYGKLGLPLPAAVTAALKQLSKQGSGRPDNSKSGESESDDSQKG
jgi:toxin secretion/phage lysis holin